MKCSVSSLAALVAVQGFLVVQLVAWSAAMTVAVDETTEAPEMTTALTGVECYQCSGASCAVATTEAHVNTTCISTLGVCFTTYDLSTGSATRGCTPISLTTTACGDPYPGGNYASNVCEACCVGEECNLSPLMMLKPHCELLKKSGATYVQPFVGAILLASVSAIVSAGLWH